MAGCSALLEEPEELVEELEVLGRFCAGSNETETVDSELSDLSTEVSSEALSTETLKRLEQATD